MFAPRYFAPRHFAPRYFPPRVADEAVKLGGPRDSTSLRDQLLREDEEILVFLAAWTEMQ